MKVITPSEINIYKHFPECKSTSASKFRCTDWKDEGEFSIGVVKEDCRNSMKERNRQRNINMCDNVVRRGVLADGTRQKKIRQTNAQALHKIKYGEGNKM